MATKEVRESGYECDNGYYQQLRDLAAGRHRYSSYVPPLMLLADAALTALIIWKVACEFQFLQEYSSIDLYILIGAWTIDTEIDWTAYMEQIEQVIAGERDYTKIKGGTGPLVYPAAHVYIYRALYRVTDHGRNILLAQSIFGVLYLSTIALAMSCYRKAKVSSIRQATTKKSLISLFLGTIIHLPYAYPLEKIT